MIEDVAESVFERRSTSTTVCVQHVRPLVLSNKAPVYSAIVSNVNTHREMEANCARHCKEHMRIEAGVLAAVFSNLRDDFGYYWILCVLLFLVV